MNIGKLKSASVSDNEPRVANVFLVEAKLGSKKISRNIISISNARKAVMSVNTTGRIKINIRASEKTNSTDKTPGNQA